jgi:hypothetical protein
MRLASITSLLVLFMVGAASGATVTVDPGGSGDYTNIAAAVSATAVGDTILLEDAVYTGSSNRNLNPIGRFIISVSGNAEDCIVDVEGYSQAFFGEYFHLQGFTIRNAGLNAVNSWGAYTDRTNKLRCVNMVFRDCNRGIWFSGTTFTQTASLEVFGCRFIDNVEGLVVDGAISTFKPTLRATGNMFEGHTGAAVKLVDMVDSPGHPIIFNNNVFRGNNIANNASYTLAPMVIFKVYVNDAGSEFVNNLFEENVTADEGGAGAIYFYSSTMVMKSLTVAGNSGPLSGSSGILVDGGFPDDEPDLEIWYSVIQGKQTCPLVNAATSEAAVYYSYLMCGSTYTNGHHIYYDNPEFVKGPAGYHYLGASSPYRDLGGIAASSLCFSSGWHWLAGYGSLCMSYSSLTTTRDQASDGGALDLGFHFTEVGDLEFWVPDDFASIQDAIDAAGPAMFTVNVRADTYYENIDFSGKDIYLTSEDGPGSTIIDAGGSGCCVTFSDWETRDAIIEGFTIQNGNVTDPVEWQDGGAGITAIWASPTIRGNVIRDNTVVDGKGAGIYTLGGDPLIEDNLVYGNEAVSDDLETMGGGIWCAGVDLGEADYIVHPEIQDNTIADNAAHYGGAMAFDLALPVVGSNVIAYNVATVDAVYCNSHATVWNPACCDIYGNYPADYTGCLEGWNGAAGNFSLNPVFCDRSSGDYSISSNSPLINPAGCGIQTIGSGQIGCLIEPDTFLVKPDGSGDFPTIQDAVDAIHDGQVILLASGVFQGAKNYDVHLAGSDITIVSQVSSADACTIDCQGSASYPRRAFIIDQGESRDLEIKHITIRNGYGYEGGAIYCEASGPYLYGMVFDNCKAAASGGAIHLETAYAQVVDCEFTSCSAGAGGAISSYGASSGSVEGCVMDGNTANSGGAFMVAEGGTTTFSGCLLINNEARWGGAGYFSSSNTEVTGCTVCWNTAFKGGSTFSIANSSPALDNSIFAFNRGPSYSFFPSLGGDPDVTDCDIYGNEGGDWVGAVSGDYGSNGNISEDPIFCDPYGGDYHLDLSSPCAAAQNPSCGLIGAYDANCTVTCDTFLVKDDGTGDYEKIQDAVDAAWNCCVIKLADGTYTGDRNRDIDLSGKVVTIEAENSSAPACTINCGGTPADPHRGFLIDDRQNELLTIRNVTIRWGYASDHGGAIYISGASPRLENVNCSFNGAGDRGGAIYMDDSNASIIDCLLHSNSGGGGGAVASFNGSAGRIEGCRIEGNIVTGGGGGFIISGDGKTRVTDCAIVYNEADWGGGGYFSGSDAVVSGCTIADNDANDGGSALSVVSSDPVIKNTILAFNDGPNNTVYCSGGSDPDLSCCDVYGNENGDFVGCISSEFGIDGNFSADPMFCRISAHIFDINYDSPCAEANNPGCGQIGAYGPHCGSTIWPRIGIYTSTDSTGISGITVDKGDTVQVYVMIRAINMPSDLVYWESNLSVSSNIQVIDFDAVNSDSSSGSVPGDLAIYASPPINIKQDAVLATMSFVRTDNEIGYLYLAALEDPSGTSDAPCFSVEGAPGVFYALEIASGSDTSAAFTIEPQSTTGDEHAPPAFSLSQNYPNPFNPTTTISFSLGARSQVSLGIYDVSGRLVAMLLDGEELEAGLHRAVWNGNCSGGWRAASGMYFYKLSAGEFTAQRKMILLR